MNLALKVNRSLQEPVKNNAMNLPINNPETLEP